jgi:hypothetical protein
MNSQNEIQELLNMFGDGSGFGDPDARRNAELKLQILLAKEQQKEQQKTATRLNWLTFFLVIVGLLNTAVLAFQVWGSK